MKIFFFRICNIYVYSPCANRLYFITWQSFENLSVDSGESLHEREDIQGTGKQFVLENKANKI